MYGAGEDDLKGKKTMFIAVTNNHMPQEQYSKM
jgi:hypothetical protein